MTPNRPYLLRALHEWILDNNMTPYVLVDANSEAVEVPKQCINEGKIILNISPLAVKNLDMNNELIQFNARFGGTPYQINIPVSSVLAIYAKENGNGMIFHEGQTNKKEEAKLDSANSSKTAHLKVIK